MNPDEYAAVSRKLAEQIGMEYFDKTTFDVHRLMYLPSCSLDAVPVLEIGEGEPINVSAVLDQYDNWRDPLQWPRHQGDILKQQSAKRMEDPRAKQGVVGAFCRCYSISEAIDEFLPEVYEQVAGSTTRYTFVGASSYGGLVLYDDDTFAYSHHESDPCSGREVNAFDLIRIHKFGKMDDKTSEKTNVTKLPSYLAMTKFAANDKRVKRERLAELSEEFSADDEEGDAWQDKLEVDAKTGLPQPTANNTELILAHGTWYGILAYDAFGNSEVIQKRLPWRERERPYKSYEPWLGADDKRLQHWFAKTYDFNSTKTIQNAFTEVVHMNTIHNGCLWPPSR